MGEAGRRTSGILLLLRRTAANHLSVFNQDAVVNNGIRTILLGDPQGAVAFAGTAWADKGDNVHRVSPLFQSVFPYITADKNSPHRCPLS